ncbi:hypothetical protein BO71DRAFT_401556 [Aspergillus ellipticus CBS 707.79]|uniref:Uncharacterized protein n=1 Tax=Aspergillus ellipticus CBS 707.79 TaxID=1448320 RepID=A0A319EJU3_9EURO|nr:hypothetical protein BO71DRAFT_401556 [Aspergillus ellipticus CBS 707.79]
MAMNSYMPSTMMGSLITLKRDEETTVWRAHQKVEELVYAMTKDAAVNEAQVPHTEIVLQCTNTDNTNQEATIIMYMQIPTSQAADAPLDIRAGEAVKEIPRDAVDLCTAYQRLKEGTDTHTPTFLGRAYQEQPDYGWVPGGYMFFLGFLDPPGIPFGNGDIGHGFFFESAPEKKQEMKLAVKRAYM